MEVYLMYILMGLAAMLKASIKNDKAKAKFKKVCLQVYLTIKTIYAGDSEFE